jgi:phosphohistidine phosphatase
MKTIILARHGKAELFSDSNEDFDRLLTDVGAERTKQVANRISDVLPAVELVMSSAAARAFATALIFADRFGLKSSRLQKVESLYECQPEQYLELIKNLDNALNCVMFVGHNPTISEFAVRFGLGIEESLPTSAVVSMSFNTDSWEKCSEIPAKLNFFLAPGML